MFKHRRKFVSVLLTCALIMTLIPTQVFAQNTTEATLNMNSVTANLTTSSGIALNPYIGDTFEAEFNVLNQWDGAFTAEIKLTNTGTEPIENWTLTFNFAQEITRIWNADIIKHENDNYIIKNSGWNQDINVGETITIGFNGIWGDEIVIPTAYKILGTKERVSATGYTVEFNILNNWEDAFTGQINIKNTGKASIEDWMLEFDFDRNIQQFWEADIIEHKGMHYVIKNRGHNANIGTGETLTLGFMADPGTGAIEASNYKLTQIADEEIEFTIDSDDDGLPDFYEEVVGTDPNKCDSDGDGLSDGYELLFTKTNPLVVDTDGNGTTDADEDLDGDQLSNLEEYKFHTNPLEIDTDCDGLIDNEEVNIYSTNPIMYDTDGDTIGDGDEIELGLDPNNTHTHDGVLDSEYYFQQDISGEDLSKINEGNDYSLEVSIMAAGNAKKDLNVNESDISGALIENRAIVGKVVNLAYRDNRFKSVELNFTLNKEYLDSTINMFPDEEVFNTVERYQIFRFDREKMFLYPIDTEFDIESNTISANVAQLGDYCVVDMQEWLFDVGLLDDSTYKTNTYAVRSLNNEIETEISNEVQPYEDISKQKLEEIINSDDSDNQEELNISKSRMLMVAPSETTINKQADLVFVIDTTGSMYNYIATVKSQIASVISYLRKQKITLHVSFVEYRDITCDGSDSTILHQKNGSSWLYNTTDMIDVLNSLSVDGGGDIPETAIDGLAMAEGLDYRKTASKYAVLVTDAGYKMDNSYGISSMDEMANMLLSKGVYTCVVGASEYYRDLYNITDGIALNIREFATELDEFIVSKMHNGDSVTYLDGLDFTTGELDEKLVKGSATDSDGDGLSDSDEVNWDYISIEGDTMHVCTLGEVLNGISDSSLSIFDRFISVLEKINNSSAGRTFSIKCNYTRAASYNKIMEMPILMPNTSRKTSPLKKDSDGDTFIDFDDPNFGDDNADKFDGLHFYFRNGLNGKYLVTDSSNKLLMHSNNATQEISLVWTGNAYKLFNQAYPDLVLTCTGNFAEMQKQQRNNDAQKWQIIPKKDSAGYMLKSLYHSNDNNVNGVYVDSSYNNTKYVWLDENAYNNSWVNLEEATPVTDWLTFKQICYNVKNRRADSDEIAAYNNYLANKNVLANNNGFDNGHDAVYGQHLPPFNQLRLGNHTMDYNGCEVFGTYNALLKAGVNVDVLELTCEFEVNGLMFNPDKGGFGSESKKIAGCLDNFGVSYKEIKTAKEIDVAVRNNEFVIITIWNSPSVFDGIHTFAARYDTSKSDVEFYNYYCNLTETYGYKSVESLMKSQNWRAIIRAYAITK